ncbi:MAG: hypothetical protein WDN03_13665 [Rhizomicrobium sp.]
MNWLRVLRNVSVPVLVVLALLALVMWRSQSVPTAPPPADAPASTATGDAGSEATWTGGEESAQRHWQKHGGEFSEFRDEESYEAGARAFVDHPPPGTLTKHRDNGDTLFYDPASDTFAVRTSDGALRTFFRPDDGAAYWERQ